MGWVICSIIAAIAGICVGVWSSGAWSSYNSGKVNSGLGWGVGIIATVIFIMLVSLPFGVRVINPGEAGVQMAFGSFTGDPLPNGVHLVAPWVQVIKYPTKIQEYTMAAQSNEGQKAGDDSVAVLCKDRLQMQIDTTTFFRPDVAQLNKIHADLGPNYRDTFLRPLIRKIVPEVFGNFDAMTVSTTGREAATKATFDALAPEFTRLGFTLTEVNLRHIQPPQVVLDAISAKLAAVEKAKQAETEGQGMVAKAKGEAQANEMKKISLTPMLLQWEQIQAWKSLATSPNAKIIIPAGGEGKLLIQP